MKRLRQLLIPLLTLAICVGIIGWWTHGFKAFTIFSATLKEAAPLNKQFPDIKLISQDGEQFHINDKNKFTLVNFVYLNCPYVCHKVNNQLEKIYHLMDTAIVPAHLEFVTISFDIKNDDLERIKRYRSYFGDNIGGWTFAIPYQTNETKFDAFLKTIGIWIYKNPKTGIINHSTDLYLISPDNRVVKIFDPNRVEDKTIAQQLKECIE